VNPELYRPLGQAFSPIMTFVIATDGDGARLASAVREQVRAVDANLPVSRLQTIEDVAAASVAARRAGMLLIAVFGALALILAAAGIHGVMSHLVALRTAEIGVRMTLGASPGRMLALILREGTLQASVGLAIGLTGGVILMRTFSTFLYGVQPADPLTLAVVAAGLLATALAACIVPARKAMHVDPVAAAQGPFGGLIASGWHTIGLMMQLFAEHYLSKVATLPSPGIDELRWARPVRPGDTLRVRVTVSEARRSRSKPDRGIVRSLVEVLNQHGEVVMSLRPMNLMLCRDSTVSA